MRILLSYFQLIILFTFTGCTLLSTREPEQPSNANASFVPPTTAYVVVDNFINAIKEQNSNSFALCLADTNRGSSKQYYFEPTAEVNTRYSGIFSRWDIVQERISLQSLISRSALDGKMSLTFERSLYDVTTPDSVVFLSDYVLQTFHTIQTIDRVAKGRLRFVIIPDKSGLWSIQRWSDYSIPNADTVFTSWSNFKAQFNN